MNACYLKANNGEREASDLMNGRSRKQRHSCVWLMHSICVRTDSQNCSAKEKKAVEFCILWSYMETITSWQMQICWQISSWVCVRASVRTHMCAVTLEHKENNCHWNVTRFHLTSVLCIGQATSGRKRGSDCKAHALQLKKLSPRGDACEAEN